MKRIEFIADDLGLDEATNLVIEHSHREGGLSGASLMLGQTGTQHGIAIARRNPNLRVGWHFHVCDSRPLTRNRWPWGRSPALAGIAIGLWPVARELVRNEIRLQWRQFVESGLHCEFINGHHHMHVHPFIAHEMRAVVPLSFNGWIRGFNLKSFGPANPGFAGWLQRPAQNWLRVWCKVQCSDTLWGVDRLFSMNASEVKRAIADSPDGLHEFLFHPRSINDADSQALLGLRELNEFSKLSRA